MPTLLVLRHAAAEPSAARDHERALTAEGRRAAADVGRALAATDTPDRALVSSARRAHETFVSARDEGGWSAPLHVLDALYHGAPQDVIAAVADHAEDSQTLLLVGHEPWCSRLIQMLTGARVRMEAAAVGSMYVGPSWNTLDPQRCVLQWFAPPRTLVGLSRRPRRFRM
jgi:phosphohistidine phosphatase